MFIFLIDFYPKQSCFHDKKIVLKMNMPDAAMTATMAKKTVVSSLSAICTLVTEVGGFLCS